MGLYTLPFHERITFCNTLFIGILEVGHLKLGTSIIVNSKHDNDLAVHLYFSLLVW